MQHLFKDISVGELFDIASNTGYVTCKKISNECHPIFSDPDKSVSNAIVISRGEKYLHLLSITASCYVRPHPECDDVFSLVGPDVNPRASHNIFTESFDKGFTHGYEKGYKAAMNKCKAKLSSILESDSI